jgi:hypothetical protein
MLKFPKVFHGSDADALTFGSQIRPRATQKAHLRGCIKKIKDHLEPRISAATKHVLGMERQVSPKFRTQGSWAYDTCIDPATKPPQEMDWDYGVYLPVTVWEDNGPPAQMARAYFNLVEGLLGDLCKEEGWTLVQGKDTCIRVQVASWAHIDIPLYAAPEDEFKKIAESAALAKAHTMDTAVLERSEYMEYMEARQQWAELDSIVMATRKGVWKHSDPKKVSNWFDDRVEEHGVQLRRACRYLKAWRDFQWPVGGPSSVLLMIATSQGFVERKGRDDLALLDSVRRLSLSLMDEVREAGIDNREEDFNKLSPPARLDVTQRLRQLSLHLSEAHKGSLNDRQLVLAALLEQFGERIPMEVSRVELDGDVAAIRQTPAVHVVAPVVPSTAAGLDDSK